MKKVKEILKMTLNAILIIMLVWVFVTGILAIIYAIKYLRYEAEYMEMQGYQYYPEYYPEHYPEYPEHSGYYSETYE